MADEDGGYASSKDTGSGYATEKDPGAGYEASKTGLTASGCKPETGAMAAEFAAAELTRTRGFSVREDLRTDKCYWFASLYCYITDAEIARRAQFKYPAFVLHFIPIFYDMYARNAELYVKNHDARSVNQVWLGHFSLGGTPSDGIKTPQLFMAETTAVVSSGVSAHILSDMPVALERAYRTYSAAYCTNGRAFDAYKSDFFDDNSKALFGDVRTTFLSELLNLGLGFGASSRPMDPALAAEVSAKMNVGLNVDQIFAWRETAWQSAKAAIGQ